MATLDVGATVHLLASYGRLDDLMHYATFRQVRPAALSPRRASRPAARSAHAVKRRVSLRARAARAGRGAVSMFDPASSGCRGMPPGAPAYVAQRAATGAPAGRRPPDRCRRCGRPGAHGSRPRQPPPRRTGARLPWWGMRPAALTSLRCSSGSRRVEIWGARQSCACGCCLTDSAWRPRRMLLTTCVHTRQPGNVSFPYPTPFPGYHVRMQVLSNFLRRLYALPREHRPQARL